MPASTVYVLAYIAGHCTIMSCSNSDPLPHSSSPPAGVYRVLAFILGQCTVVSGPNTKCKATVLANVNTYVSAELCYDGRSHRSGIFVSVRPDARSAHYLLSTHVATFGRCFSFVPSLSISFVAEHGYMSLGNTPGRIIQAPATITSTCGCHRKCTFSPHYCPSPSPPPHQALTKTRTGSSTRISHCCSALPLSPSSSGIDNDQNGLIDKDDPACWFCGDGYLDNQVGETHAHCGTVWYGLQCPTPLSKLRTSHTTGVPGSTFGLGGDPAHHQCDPCLCNSSYYCSPRPTTGQQSVPRAVR